MALVLKQQLTSYLVYIVERHIDCQADYAVGHRMVLMNVHLDLVAGLVQLVVADVVDQPRRQMSRVDHYNLELMSMS